jgi:hypothetical protein
MCLICVDLIKQKMTIKEAGRAVNEMLSAAWIDDPKKFNYEDYKHKKKLKEALEDHGKLVDIILEGSTQERVKND